MESNVCQACGVVNDPTARFCFRCGAALAPAAAAAPPEPSGEEGGYGGATYDFGRTEPAYRSSPTSAPDGPTYAPDDSGEAERPRSILLPVVLAIGGLAAGLLVVLFMVRGAGPAEPTQSPGVGSRQTASPTADAETPTSGSPSPTARTEPPTPSPEPTTAAYAVLEGYVPLSYGLCEPAPDLAEEDAIATMRCNPDPPVAFAFFDLFDNSESMNRAMDEYIGSRTGGSSCRSGSYVGTWYRGEEGSPTAGELLCYIDSDNEAVIIWTDWEVLVMGQMYRHARDIDPLYEFWAENGLEY